MIVAGGAATLKEEELLKAGVVLLFGWERISLTMVRKVFWNNEGFTYCRK